jgi:arylsulfatase A-like enzyme
MGDLTVTRSSPFVLLTLLAVAVAGCAPPLDLAQPNVLLIVVDCLRADHVGTYGYERPTTPWLDRLAEEGVTFERAFAQSYWTRPSLPTILTGLYPSEHGLLSLDQDERGRWVGAALDPEVETVTEGFDAAGYATALMGYQRQLAPKFRLANGFDFYHYKVGNASSINGRFLEWAAQLEEPRFFAYLHYLDIHWPYCPPESTRDRFDSGESEVEFCKDWKRLRRRIWNGQLVLEPRDVARAMARYDEELLALDGKLGELFETLRVRGVWEETLVVVTADHGEEFMEHGELDHSSGPFDTLIHVPLIVKPPAAWPGVRGSRVDSLVELRALKSTFLDAAGLIDKRPVDSLVPWIVDRPRQAERRPYVIAESDTHVALRTERFKLVVTRAGKEATLYDLVEDPGETRDVAADRPEELRRMRRYLADWRRSLRPTTVAKEILDADTVEGLRDLGYLD